MSYVTGIDVSHHQSFISWSKVATAGHQFAIVKATQGTGYVDPLYARNEALAKSVGLVVGAYLFHEYDRDSAKQAQLFAKVAAHADFWCVDLESFPRNGMTVKAPPTSVYLDRVSELIAELHRLDPHKLVVIYTAAWWWNPVAGGSARFAEYPLWVASYRTTPSLPRGWSSWTFWQHTSSGSCPGVTGRVDLNRFNGTSDDLRRLVALSHDPLMVSVGGGDDDVNAVLVRKIGDTGVYLLTDFGPLPLPNQTVLAAYEAKLGPTIDLPEDHFNAAMAKAAA